MKPYGLKKPDRVTCTIKGCKCGDMSSKHPKDNRKYVISRKMKSKERSNAWKKNYIG